MRASVTPDLIDKLLAIAPALFEASNRNVRTTDGDPTTLNTQAFFAVGVQDPEAGVQNAAESDGAFPLANGARTRERDGGVWCAAFTAGATLKAARDAAYGIADDIAGAIAADPRLGLTRILWCAYGAEQLKQWQTGNGPVALLNFRIDYKARV